MKFKKLVLILCLFIASLFSFVPVYASANDLSNITMDVYLNEDGSARIVETWEIYVTEGTEIYKEMKNMSGSEIYDFSVSEGETSFTALSSWDINASRQEKKYKSGIIQNGNSYELCFGVGDYGQHTFTFQYTISNFVDQYSDIYGMNYRLINEMNTMPDWFVITIHSSLFTNETKVYAFGFEGTIYLKENNGEYYIEATNVLAEGEYGGIQYANVLSGFYGASFTSANPKHSSRSFQDMVDEAMEGSDYQKPTNDQDYYNGDESYYDNETSNFFAVSFGSEFRYFSMAIIYFIAMGLMFFLLIKNRGQKNSSGLKFTDNQNELIKKAEVNYFRDIPCHKNLYVFYYICLKVNLINEQEAKSGMLSAILLSWIRSGIITFEKRTKQGLFSKKDIYAIDFSKNVEFEVENEQELYNYFRLAAGNDGILENKEFEKWCKKNYTKIDAWFLMLEVYCESLVKELGYMETHIVESKVLFFPQKRKINLYTPEFREEIYHVIGFQKFLKEFSSLNEKQVLEVMLWEDYLIFASILGLAEKIEKEIGQLYPEFVEHSNLDIYYVTMATRMFAYNGITSAARASKAASNDSSFHGGGGSSSFGGGGGSFSGGGGGGVR